MDHTNEIPIKVRFYSTKKVAFCRFPLWLAQSTHKQSEVILISLTGSCKNEKIQLHVSWNGGISNSDELELYLNYTPDILNNEATLSIVNHVYDATEVYVEPCTSADWDIILSTANKVEDIFLQQYDLLYITQLVRIILSPSMHIMCKVTDIKYYDNISNSNTSTTSDSDNIKISEKWIGKLSVDTLLIVAPYIHKTGNNNTTNNPNTNSSSIVTDIPCNMILRVLPDHLKQYSTSCIYNDMKTTTKTTDTKSNTYTSTNISMSPQTSITKSNIKDTVLKQLSQQLINFNDIDDDIDEIKSNDKEIQLSPTSSQPIPHTSIDTMLNDILDSYEDSYIKDTNVTNNSTNAANKKMNHVKQKALKSNTTTTNTTNTLNSQSTGTQLSVSNDFNRNKSSMISIESDCMYTCWIHSSRLHYIQYDNRTNNTSNTRSDPPNQYNYTSSNNHDGDVLHPFPHIHIQTNLSTPCQPLLYKYNVYCNTKYDTQGFYIGTLSLSSSSSSSPTTNTTINTTSATASSNNNNSSSGNNTSDTSHISNKDNKNNNSSSSSSGSGSGSGSRDHSQVNDTSYVVQVKVCDTIRYDSIYIPMNIRRVMNITEYQSIQLHLFSPSEMMSKYSPFYMSYLLRLCPIQWSSNTLSTPKSNSNILGVTRQLSHHLDTNTDNNKTISGSDIITTNTSSDTNSNNNTTTSVMNRNINATSTHNTPINNDTIITSNNASITDYTTTNNNNNHNNNYNNNNNSNINQTHIKGATSRSSIPLTPSLSNIDNISFKKPTLTRENNYTSTPIRGSIQSNLNRLSTYLSTKFISTKASIDEYEIKTPVRTPRKSADYITTPTPVKSRTSIDDKTPLSSVHSTPSYYTPMSTTHITNNITTQIKSQLMTSSSIPIYTQEIVVLSSLMKALDQNTTIVLSSTGTIITLPFYTLHNVTTNLPSNSTLKHSRLTGSQHGYIQNNYEESPVNTSNETSFLSSYTITTTTSPLRNIHMNPYSKNRSHHVQYGGYSESSLKRGTSQTCYHVEYHDFIVYLDDEGDKGTNSASTTQHSTTRIILLNNQVLQSLSTIIIGDICDFKCSSSLLPLQYDSTSNTTHSKTHSNTNMINASLNSTINMRDKFNTHHYFQQFYGQQKLIQSLLQQLSTLFLPPAIYNRIHYNVLPTHSAILAGPAQAGKSTLLTHLSKYCHDHPYLQTHVEYFYAEQYIGQPITKIIPVLTSLYEKAWKNAPTIVCIDNLDLLLPVFEIEKIVQVGYVNDTSSILSLHISRLLQQCNGYIQESHQNARSIYHTYINHIPINDTYKEASIRAYYHHQLVTQALHKNVFTLVTTTSMTSLHTSLLDPICLSKFYQIKPLSVTNRIRLFQNMVTEYHGVLDPTLVQEPQCTINTCTQGYYAGDVIALARRCCIYSQLKYSRYTQSSNNTTYADSENEDNCVSSHYLLSTQHHDHHISPTHQLATRGGSSNSSNTSSVNGDDSIYSNSVYSRNERKKYQFLITTEDFYTVYESFISHTSGTKAKSSTPKVTWKHVGGYHTQRKELTDVFLLPRLYKRLFKYCPIKLSQAVLLYGPTGCGKTHLARAIGYECGLDCHMIKGPEILDKYIGASEKAIRDLFQKASLSGKPSLIFFDEFEALAPKRGRDNTGITDRIVNQLLTLLDGVESITKTKSYQSDDDEENNSGNNDKTPVQVMKDTLKDKKGNTIGNIEEEEEEVADVYILAATSRPDLIDPALLRPGRIDRHIYITYPHYKDRIEILDNLFSHIGIDIHDSTNMEIKTLLIKIVSDFKLNYLSVADLKSIITIAQLHAIERQTQELSYTSHTTIPTTTNTDGKTSNYNNVMNNINVDESGESNTINRQDHSESPETDTSDNTHINTANTATTITTTTNNNPGNLASNGDILDPSRKTDKTAIINVEDLQYAYTLIRPSMSNQDRMYFQYIYDKFRGIDTHEENTKSKKTIESIENIDIEMKKKLGTKSTFM